MIYDRVILIYIKGNIENKVDVQQTYNIKPANLTHLSRLIIVSC